MKAPSTPSIRIVTALVAGFLAIVLAACGGGGGGGAVTLAAALQQQLKNPLFPPSPPINPQ